VLAEVRLALLGELRARSGIRGVAHDLALVGHPHVAHTGGRVLERDQGVTVAPRESSLADQQPARLAVGIDEDVLELADRSAVDVVDTESQPAPGLVQCRSSCPSWLNHRQRPHNTMGSLPTSSLHDDLA